MTDQELIDNLKKGDQSALKNVYSHLSLIKNMVLKNSGSVDDAYDLFQDSVLIFYKNVVKKDFELKSSISTYLYSISYRQWLKKLRGRKSESLMNLNENYSPDLIEEFNFETFDSTKENRLEIVLAMIDQLGENCKKILNLFYFQGLDLEAISNRMGYNSSQVARQQKYRCLKQVRDLLKEKQLTDLN